VQGENIYPARGQRPPRSRPRQAAGRADQGRGRACGHTHPGRADDQLWPAPTRARGRGASGRHRQRGGCAAQRSSVSNAETAGDRVRRLGPASSAKSPGALEAASGTRTRTRAMQKASSSVAPSPRNRGNVRLEGPQATAGLSIARSLLFQIGSISFCPLCLFPEECVCRVWLR
jgi:hypothetical protein